MKKLFLLLLAIFAIFNNVIAQELTVKSFAFASTDITAQTEGRKDLNGDACALVKISFVGEVIDVEGNVIKPLVKRNNETWVFMTQESQQMKVITKDNLPLMVSFRDYGIEKLQGNRTYVLTLAKPSGALESQQNQTLTIRYSPVSASVLIDNKIVKGFNGIAKTSLPIGQHSFVVACEGYESEEGMVKLKASAPSNLQITLSKEIAQPISFTTDSSTSSTSSNTVDGSTSGSVITIPVKNGISIEMVKVEGGSFNMGATPEMEDPFDWEKPVHRVTLTKNYYIGKYEVTQALWQAVMGSNPSGFKGDNLPVENVSWNDCQDFISKLNAMTGKRFRLPTEAEWEYAARGAKKSRGYQYSGSNTLGNVAWYDGNSGFKTHAVGTKQPNELGIYDMTGNVWEWCQDWYDSYSSSPQTNPTGAVSGSSRVYRGGCWYNSARICRSSVRYGNTPGGRDYFIGLRLVLSE